MKDLSQRIYEGMDMKTTMYFDNMAALCIFAGEEAGQISDGKYENSRPASHWQWLNDLTVKFDKKHDNGYYSNYQHRVKYNIDEWVKYIKGGDPDWAWANRVLAYGKVGAVLEKINKTNVSEDYGKYESAVRFFEYYDEELTSDTVKDLEEKIKAQNKSFISDYFKYAKKEFLTDEFLKTYNETEYTIRDLKADLVDMNESVNTFLGYSEK